MKIAVILPIYNVASWIKRCLDSLSAQTYQDFFVVAVDDGSTDESAAIVEQYAGEKVLIRQKNGGVAAARNRGVREALSRGADYIAFVDPDDAVHPEYLATLVAGLKGEEVIAAVGYQEVTDGGSPASVNDQPLEELTAEDYWLKPKTLPMSPCVKLIPALFFTGVEFPVGRVHEDEATMARLIFKAKKINYCPRQLYYYYLRTTSITHGDNSAKWTRDSLDHIAAVKDQVNFFLERKLDRPLVAARRLLVSYCVKAIEELGRTEFRPLLKEQLKALGWDKDYGEEYVRVAYPWRSRLEPKMKKLIKGLLPYGLVRLVEKYREAHTPEPEEVSSASLYPVDPSTRGRNVLLVDALIPAYDRDAGGKQITIYVKLLAKLGFKVYLMGDYPLRREPYSTEFEAAGVTVLTGPEFGPGRRNDWFRKNGPLIDFVFLHRPGTAINFWHLAKIYTNAKFIFFGADVAQIRLQREYELTHDESLKEEIKAAKREEDFLYTHCDQNLAVGTAEVEWIGKTYPAVPIREIPLFVYEKFVESVPTFGERKDIMFVGGFNHRPNRDAVNWFVKEILPEVRKSCPGIKFHIVGAPVLPEVSALKSEEVIVHGFMPDAELDALYNQCRVTVAPLRYGAGVKGKIVEAMYHRSVVVTTSCGAEGIPQSPKPFAIADDTVQFAAEVVKAYTDESVWNKYHQDSLKLIKSTYSVKRAEDLISEVFRR